MHIKNSLTLKPHEFDRIFAELYNSRYTNGVDVEKFVKINKKIKPNQDYVITVCSESYDKLWKGVKMELAPHEIYGILSNLKITSKKNDPTFAKFHTLKRALDKIEKPRCIITLRDTKK